MLEIIVLTIGGYYLYTLTPNEAIRHLIGLIHGVFIMYKYIASSKTPYRSLGKPESCCCVCTEEYKQMVPYKYVLRLCF